MVLDKQYGSKVEVINLFYDIKDVKNKKTSDDFYDIILENLDQLVIK